jgi:hypothetical protein
MRRPLFVCAVTAVLCALVLGSCSRGGPETPAQTVGPLHTASSPSPKRAAIDSEACALLTSRERRSIGGEWMNKVAPAPAGRNYRQCRWLVSFSSPQHRALLVQTMLAHTWATTFAVTQIDKLLTTRVNDEETRRELQAAKVTIKNEAGKLSDKKACGIFSLIVAKSASRKKSSAAVAYLPAGADLSVNGLICTDGVFTQVKYTEPGLRQSGVLEQATMRLLRIAQKRAVKLDWSGRA